MRFLKKFWLNIVIVLVVGILAFFHSAKGYEQCGNIISFILNSVAILTILISFSKFEEGYEKEIAELPMYQRYFFILCDVVMLFYALWYGWLITATLWLVGCLSKLNVILTARRKWLKK